MTMALFSQIALHDGYLCRVSLSGPDLYQLFVDELEIVEGDELSNSDVGNVENNLRQFAYQFFKKKAVSQTA